jgi:hypothetical protein
MSRNELIAGCLVALMVISGILINGFNSHQCKLEALKAGKNAEDIVRICGR